MDSRQIGAFPAHNPENRSNLQEITAIAARLEQSSGDYGSRHEIESIVGRLRQSSRDWGDRREIAV